jgi:phenylacetate-CoA ligase
MIDKIRFIPFLLKEYWAISHFEKWSPEKIERYQVKAFRKIFKSAKKLPFYKELYSSAGVFDTKINSLEDLKKLPVIDKALCRNKGYEEYFSGKAIPGTMITSTTGSTGKPFQIRIPSKIEMLPPTKVIHAMRQFGWTPLDKGLEIWRDNSSTHKNFMRKIGLLRYISFFNPLESIKAKIEKEKPDYLFSIRTFYMYIADYLQEVNFKYKPKFLLCTAEEVHEQHRRKLEEFFQAKLLNIYGCMESPTIAYTCPEQARFHVFQTTVILEILNKRTIDGSMYGDVAITNLNNNIMPFIRYKTGDIVKVEEDKCPCKRNSQILGEIQGRSDDSIKIANDEIITLQHFSQKFRNINIIDQYKVVYQRRSRDLIFYFKLKKNTNPLEGKELLNDLFKQNFSNYNYKILIVDFFEISASGKFKVFEVIEG